MTREQRLEELAALVGVWRSARCTRRKGYAWALQCHGDDHVEGCAAKRALDDVTAAHNALGAPGMR